jgi:hypothetical protein
MEPELIKLIIPPPIRNFLYVLLFFLFALSCAEEPVADDYFLDPDRILGKNSPLSPVIIGTESCFDSAAERYNLTIDFNDENNTVVDGTGYDSDGDRLIYMLFYSYTDPAGFSEDEYYSEERYCCYKADITPLQPVSHISGNIWLWMTAYDGGRMSDRSEILSHAISTDECVP